MKAKEYVPIADLSIIKSFEITDSDPFHLAVAHAYNKATVKTEEGETTTAATDIPTAIQLLWNHFDQPNERLFSLYVFKLLLRQPHLRMTFEMLYAIEPEFEFKSSHDEQIVLNSMDNMPILTAQGLDPEEALKWAKENFEEYPYLMIPKIFNSEFTLAQQVCLAWMMLNSKATTKS